MALLEIEDLHVELRTWKQTVRAVNGLDLRVEDGEILGLIGESGSGKSMTAKAILRSVPGAPGITSGRIKFEGRELTTVPETEMRKLRGRRIAFVSQDPLSSLNPVFRVGSQMRDALVWQDVANDHFARARFLDRWSSRGRKRRREARRAASELLRRVELPAPDLQLQRFPHELSGGMRQRALLALAMSGKPKLLIADEPTTALDVTVQAQILALLRQIVKDEGTSVLYISHDLGVVGQVSDSIAVMYAGRIVERAPSETLLRTPLHPYTEGLMAAAGGLEGAEMQEIPGEPVDLARLPPGCPFHPRCPLAQPACATQVPALNEVAPRHWLACPPRERLLYPDAIAQGSVNGL